MTWAEIADSIIAKVDAALPADADLKARKKALAAAKPYEFRATSWGKKVWPKRVSRYLAKHGQMPRKKAPLEAYLSPLERAKRKSLGGAA